MTRAFISLGGNVGQVERTLDRALEDLAAHPAIAVRSRSSWHRTQAVGAAAGGEFLNGTAELSTELSAFALLEVQLSVEDQHGRVRSGRWSPRTLDLDLLLYGEAVIDSSRLRVPHPACWYRRFVLDPLAEIAADVTHPEKGTSIAALRSRLLVRPLPVGVAGGEPDARRQLIERLGPQFSEAMVGEWHGPETSREPALLFWLGIATGANRAAAEPAIRFEELPVLPRLDLSRVGDAETFARDVVAAALG
jgi:2-amino-4-hydroxy-6-hydroxymethyldihydropteridine diphosphokinase